MIDIIHFIVQDLLIKKFNFFFNNKKEVPDCILIERAKIQFSTEDSDMDRKNGNQKNSKTKN